MDSIKKENFYKISKLFHTKPTKNIEEVIAQLVDTNKCANPLITDNVVYLTKGAFAIIFKVELHNLPFVIKIIRNRVKRKNNDDEYIIHKYLFEELKKNNIYNVPYLYDYYKCIYNRTDKQYTILNSYFTKPKKKEDEYEYFFKIMEYFEHGALYYFLHPSKYLSETEERNSYMVAHNKVNIPNYDYYMNNEEKYTIIYLKFLLLMYNIKLILPSFRHFDLHTFNILVRETKTPIEYAFDKFTVNIPEQYNKIQLILNDFDYSIINNEDIQMVNKYGFFDNQLTDLYKFTKSYYNYFKNYMSYELRQLFYKLFTRHLMISKDPMIYIIKYGIIKTENVEEVKKLFGYTGALPTVENIIGDRVFKKYITFKNTKTTKKIKKKLL